MDDLKANLDKVSALNSALNKENHELMIKEDTLTQQVESLERKVKALVAEKSHIYDEMEGLQHSLDDLEIDYGKLQVTNDELVGHKEGLSKQMKTLRKNLEDEIARAELQKAQLEEERDEIKFR